MTPIEFYIPSYAEVVWVHDFFASELTGGAELTSEAIIRACPKKIFQIHSGSLTESLIRKHKTLLWIFGNQTKVSPQLLALFVIEKIPYVFFEYDWKPCVMRSTSKHTLALNGSQCRCHLEQHGLFQAWWMAHAKILFWCSSRQRQKFTNLFPKYDTASLGNHVVQNSTFFPETILRLRDLRNKRRSGEIAVQNRWAILDSDSWIKGTSDSVQRCKDMKEDFVLLKGLSNEEFILELAKSKGMIFLPRDQDVGSRTSVEAKLLGLELILNDHVQTQFEPWWSGTIEEIEEFQLDGPDRFWRELKQRSLF